MKKVFAGLLILSMLFSIVTPVFAGDMEQNQQSEAADVEENASVNVGNNGEATENAEDEEDTGNRPDVPEENTDGSSSEKDVPENKEVEASKEKINDDGGVHYGWYYKKRAGWYHYNAKGVKEKGWVCKNKNWYYLDPKNDGLMLSNCHKTINGKEYAFKKDGSMVTGWEYVRGAGWYYYGNYGKITGWKEIGRIWYYLEPKNGGQMASGCHKTINGKEYAFKKDGSMITGWEYVKGAGWYYHGNYGKITGWKKVGKFWYYLNPGNKGLMLSNCHKKINGKEYSFKKDGSMTTGWEYAGGKWYYYGNYGKEAGWKKLKNIWYYLDPAENKQMLSNQWKVINGKWYYFNKSGAMAVGWLLYDGWYYMGNDGGMKTGWQQVGNEWYYFYKQKDPHGGICGKMATNITVDGIKIGSDGRMINFQKMMAVFSTTSTNDANGTYNMTKALKSFNQVVLMPGQTLSFFGVAGPCGAAQGYMPGGVVGGVGYGGGICQASTTLYGAMLRAGLTIVERHNHSVPSTYVPIGQDAMVNYGTSDLRIRNDYTFPVKIATYVSGNTLYAEIWGTQPGWFDRVDINSWWTGSRTAIAYRNYVKNGKVVKTEQLPASFY